MPEPGTIIEFPVEYRAGYERFVDKHEVARLLGKSVSWVEKASVDKRVAPMDRLPSHKIGANRMYRLSEVVGWVERSAA